jgi:hypothetical protein
VYRRTISKNDDLLASSVLTQFASDIKQSKHSRVIATDKKLIDPQDPERKREKGLNNSPTLKVAIIS